MNSHIRSAFTNAHMHSKIILLALNSQQLLKGNVLEHFVLTVFWKLAEIGQKPLSCTYNYMLENMTNESSCFLCEQYKLNSLVVL